MNPQTMISKLESIQAYAEGLIIEVERFKKEVMKGEAPKKRKGLSKEELDKLSARYRSRAILKK